MVRQEMLMCDPFAVTDCALIPIATGERAYNLRELRDRLIRAEDPGIIYYHFWGGMLRPHFVDPEYQNHFAGWAYHDLHDRRLAERLSIVNPAHFASIEGLRQQVIEVIEERMDEEDGIQRLEAEHPFFFMRSQIVVFDSRIRVNRVEELAEKIEELSLGSVFYHFIDARRRTASGEDDFTEWLKCEGNRHRKLMRAISAIDPYFNSLIELREQLAATFRRQLPVEDRS
jgi:hypothetical protein